MKKSEAKKKLWLFTPAWPNVILISMYGMYVFTPKAPPDNPFFRRGSPESVTGFVGSLTVEKWNAGPATKSESMRDSSSLAFVVGGCLESVFMSWN